MAPLDISCVLGTFLSRLVKSSLPVWKFIIEKYCFSHALQPGAQIFAAENWVIYPQSLKNWANKCYWKSSSSSAFEISLKWFDVCVPPRRPPKSISCSLDWLSRNDNYSRPGVMQMELDFWRGQISCCGVLWRISEEWEMFSSRFFSPETFWLLLRSRICQLEFCEEFSFDGDFTMTSLLNIERGR